MLQLDSKYQEVWMAAKSGPPPVLVNKVLLAQGHTHPCTHHLWQLSGDKGRVEQPYQKPYGLESQKDLLSGQRERE